MAYENYTTYSTGGASKIKTPEGKMSLHPISTRNKNWWTLILKKYGKMSYKGKTRTGNSYIIMEN